MTAAPITWRVLVRRGWIVALAALAGLGVGAKLARVSVSATSVFHVRVDPGHRSPYQASRLARTYARLLPEEPSLLRAVAADTGLTPRQVRARLSMVASPATAIVFERFSARDAGSAIAGLEAVNRALRAATDATGAPLRATLAPLADPGLSGGYSRTKALALGLIAGLALGLALALALERRAPRVDDLRDLARAVPLPVSRVSERALPAVVAPLVRHAPGADADDVLLVRRGSPAAGVEAAWRERAGAGRPLVAALLVEPCSRLSRVRGARDGVRAA